MPSAREKQDDEHSRRGLDSADRLGVPRGGTTALGCVVGFHCCSQG